MAGQPWGKKKPHPCSHRQDCVAPGRRLAPVRGRAVSPPSLQAGRLSEAQAPAGLQVSRHRNAALRSSWHPSSGSRTPAGSPQKGPRNWRAPPTPHRHAGTSHGVHTLSRNRKPGEPHVSTDRRLPPGALWCLPPPPLISRRELSISRGTD